MEGVDGEFVKLLVAGAAQGMYVFATPLASTALLYISNPVELGRDTTCRIRAVPVRQGALLNTD
jgi:hypothetical protein